VIEWAGQRWPRLAIGGRSMGGRIASQVVSQGTAATSLTLFAYPLHPPGRPEQRRDGHLAAIAVPTLFCSGTRDAFGSADELREAATKVAGARLRFLEGADHGFNVLRASGRTRQIVWAEAADALIGFLRGQAC
jgi:predicted alpha/beta-hydrolase family hydrolase